MAKARELTNDQDLWLWFGFGVDPFGSRREGREAWERAGGEAHFGSGRAGQRSAGWWVFEAGGDAPRLEDYPDPDVDDDDLLERDRAVEAWELDRLVFLARHHMDEDEARAVVVQWVEYLKPGEDLVGDYFCDAMHHQAVRTVTAVVAACPDVEFVDVLGERRGWLAAKG